MSLEVTGKLYVKYDSQQVSDRFKKREFVLELAEEINGNVYTNYAKMQLVQNKCELLDRYNEGDQIKVTFNIKGNRWEKDGKVNFITNLDAWRIEAANAGAMPQQQQPAQAMPGNYNNAMPANNAAPAYQNNNNNFYNAAPDNVDDLPF